MASNSIIQCSSSSHAIKTYEYDVFVSFRGEDTRNNFTGFLFEALCRIGIEAFKDTEDLKKGNSIAPELLQAIQGSRLFVVVFSKNYASSTWCLRELVEIFNCFEPSERPVLPIFYDVDPSEVRKQNGFYEKAFAKHQETFRGDKEKMEEVLRWRKTLSKVADISGWDIGNKPQYTMIEEIAQNIKQILGSKFSSLPQDNLVGMKSQVEEFVRRLHLESVNDVRVVGISGMGGIGKTTLARALYEQISHQYNSHCFVDDVSQTYRKHSGALGVQKQLLSQSIKEKNMEICNVSEGTQLICTRLRKAKGLIVFDNVDQVEQLNIFSGSREFRECLGGGSRVIIISRDEHILKAHGVDDVYKVEPLNSDNAIELFCKKAFKRSGIISGYEELTHAILSHVQGHPLTIEVIGSSLFDKNISQWRSTLAQLRNNPSEDIMDKLRIGFDELNGTNKELFLDIACLFDFPRKKFVKEILDFRGFSPEVGLQVLVDKSLVTIIGEDIHMHKLLKDLGKYIVREKSPNEPTKWSRLWDYQDLHKVMSDNMEESNIEAIVVDFVPMEFHETTLKIDALSKMRNLKLLMLPKRIKTSGSLNYLSNELGYVTWNHFPFECLPPCFQPHKLVHLYLKRSNIKQLWGDTKPLQNVRYLNLSYSQKLVKMQNFGEAKNLKSLNLQACIRLKQIDPSIGFPENLTTLNLKDCRSLINLPHFRKAQNLEILNLEGCTKLKQIDPSIGCLRKLTVLNLKNCKSLVSLPNNILELNSLEYLSLSGCSRLYNHQLLEEPRDAEHSKKLCIGDAPSHSQSTSSTVKRLSTWILQLFSRKQKDSVNWLLPSLSIFSCMRHLDMSFCNLLQVPDAIGNLHSLERLCLMGNNFAVMPSLKELSNLIHLNLQHCKLLEKLPEFPSRTDVPSPNYIPPSLIVEHLNRPGFDDVSGLNIFNCPELAEGENCNNLCFTWMMQIIKAHHQYNPHEYDGMMWPPRFSSIIQGSEIPRWFKSEHVCKDNSMGIDAVNVFDSDLMGVACSAIFVARNQRGMAPPKEVQDFGSRIPLLFRGDLITVELDHLWLFYFTRSVIRRIYQSSLVEVFRDKELSFGITGGIGYDVEVKKYGYRYVYEKDLQLSNLTMMHTETWLPQKRKFSAIEEDE